MRPQLRTRPGTSELRVDLTALCAVNWARVVLEANACAFHGAPRHRLRIPGRCDRQSNLTAPQAPLFPSASLGKKGSISRGTDPARAPSAHAANASSRPRARSTPCHWVNSTGTDRGGGLGFGRATSEPNSRFDVSLARGRSTAAGLGSPETLSFADHPGLPCTQTTADIGLTLRGLRPLPPRVLNGSSVAFRAVTLHRNCRSSVRQHRPRQRAPETPFIRSRHQPQQPARETPSIPSPAPAQETPFIGSARNAVDPYSPNASSTLHACSRVRKN